MSCILFDTFAEYHPSITIEEHMPSMSLFSEQVIKRYYVIQHFAIRMQIVSSMYAYSSDFYDIFISECAALQIRSPYMQAVINSLIQAQTIDPFLQAWQQYTTYAYIEDELLNDDMWICLDCMMRASQYMHGASHRTIINYISEELKESTIVAIVFRFYFLQKIEHSIRRLKRISYAHMYKPLFFDHLTTLFKHPLVQSCIEKMAKSRTIKPFFSLYNGLASYDHLTDVRLYRDFSMLTLFIVNMAHAESIDTYAQKKEKDSLEDFIWHDLGLTKEQCITYVIRRMYHINRLLCGHCTAPLPEYSFKSTVRPLLFSWVEFSRYGNLKDQLLIDSCAQELFLLSDHDIPASQGNMATFIMSSQLLIKDMIAQDTEDVDSHPHIDTIIERLYYVYRLEHIIQKVISCIRKKNSIVPSYTNLFSHKKIVHYYQLMCEQSSLYPYIHLHSLFQAYYYIADTQFTREYLYLLYVTIISITQKTAIEIQTITQMSLPELIVLIDQAAQSIDDTVSGDIVLDDWWQPYIKKIDSYLSALFSW